MEGRTFPKLEERQVLSLPPCGTACQRALVGAANSAWPRQERGPSMQRGAYQAAATETLSQKRNNCPFARAGGIDYKGKVVINRTNHYRAAWVSDVHLGTRGSNAPAFLAFLKENEFDTLYIVGDLIDIWSLRRGIYWPQEHNDVIQKVLRKARKGARVIYIPGNHDEFLSRHLGAYGAITIQKHAVHLTADGRRILVLHGHELDTVVQNIKWLALLGDLGYQFLLALNPLINFVRRIFGFGYWSLSKAVKARVKDAVSFIGAYEDAIVRYAERYHVEGVLCGHIHSPVVRQIGSRTYYNCGDWVENCSALVEHEDGTIELLTNYQGAAVFNRSEVFPARGARIKVYEE